MNKKIFWLCYELASTFMLTAEIYFGGTLGTALQLLPKVEEYPPWIFVLSNRYVN